MEHQDTYHYQLIRRALDKIDANGRQLPLADLAAQLQMSPAYFQRLFSRWVGVSPKKYQEYLTLGHAKTLLENRMTLLDAAQDTGLSGTGRLHDLFVRWEAMSPGDYAAKGADLSIRWGLFDSPFGEMLAMGTDRGLCGMAFTDECGRDTAMHDMQGRWPDATYTQDASFLQNWVDGALTGTETRLTLMGTPLQIKVWEALLHIPSGHVTTYTEIARSIGNPRAVRAVGSAVGRNPISWIIPCHRALRKSGALGGYHWGMPVKRAMLAWESARLDATG